MPSSTIDERRAGLSLPDAVRHRFPVFENRTYVNSCSQGALSDAVRNAYEEYLEGLESEGSLWEHWVDRQERVRVALARLLHAPAHDVAVTASASAALNAVSSAMDFSGPRNGILTTDLEFPTAAQIWHAQAGRGAQVRTVGSEPDFTIPLERFEAAIDDTTALVSLSHVCYRNGARLDLAPIIELAHERGALVVVDVYQSVGAIPLDVQTLGPDFVVGGVLKYLLGSPGVGFLYANAASASALVPTATGWFAAKDIFAMRIDGYEPAADARRFEAGTPSIPSIYAAAASIELMLEIGVEATERHVKELCRQLRDGIEGLGGHIVTPPGSPGPMVAVAATDEEACVSGLAEAGVVVSSRDGNVRISPHCYNNATDMDRVLAAIRDHRHLLR